MCNHIVAFCFEDYLERPEDFRVALKDESVKASCVLNISISDGFQMRWRLDLRLFAVGGCFQGSFLFS